MATNRITLKIDGIKEMKRATARVRDRAITALRRALFQEAVTVMNDSKRTFVPVDLGTLRSSGAVFPPETRGSSIEVTLGYAGAASAYAVHVHENMTAKHRVGGPKYLERPILAAVSGMEKRLGSVLKHALKRRRR